MTRLLRWRTLRTLYVQVNAWRLATWQEDLLGQAILTKPELCSAGPRAELNNDFNWVDCMRKINSTPFFTPYAIRQLVYTPWLYAIFCTCAQVMTMLRHSHIEFKQSQLIQFNTNWRLYESVVNLNQMLVIKSCVYKCYAMTKCMYSVYIYLRTLIGSIPSLHLQ